ncbi:hypothetical protein V7793_07440 [Streptomyces sp. KLMMK]|uniref:hypothetical protein n=1 Tax=Streptomyces sp. KLMMK TaxID=3109353 RepID=UPI002FFF7638
MKRVRSAAPSPAATRLLTAGLTVGLTVAGLTAVQAAPRDGADRPGAAAAAPQTFQHVATGRCLDDHGGPGNLRTFPCNNTTSQAWR